MNASEMRDLSVQEIRQQIDEREEELINLKLQLVTHQLEDGLSVRIMRREVARLRTVLREHELGIRKLPGEGE